MARFVCMVTGPVVGLESRRLLRETTQFANGLGKKIVVFDLFDEVIREAELTVKNPYERLVRIGELMDGYQYQFDLMRQNAYQSIAREIDRLPSNTNVIVRAPVTIESRGVNVEFKDHRVIAETINPDRIVTLIDAEWKILDKLKTNYGETARRVIFQEGVPGVAAILRWLGAEVSRSEDMAEWCRQLTGKPVRHYVLGVMVPGIANRGEFYRDVDNMTKVACERSLPSFYSSYSITVATEDARAEINRAIRQLRDFGLVIDPASIEIPKNTRPEDEGVVFAYTVARDLRWDVRKVDIVAAIHPYRKNPPLSTGMTDELGHARALRKERYLVLSSGAGSPFTGGEYIPKNHLFGDVDSFFEFIEKKRRPTLKPRFHEQVQAFARWQAAAKRKGDHPAETN